MTPAGTALEVFESPKISWEAGSILTSEFGPCHQRQGKPLLAWHSLEEMGRRRGIAHSFGVSGELSNTGGYCCSLSLCSYPVTMTWRRKTKKREVWGR